jgi:hypothetical protein
MGEPVRIRPFAAQDEVGERDVVALWMRETALSLEEALRRVREVLLVAVSGGAPVGVCTVYLEHDRDLRMPLWYFRAFVSEAYRQQHLALRLLDASRRHLAARYEQGVDQRGAGVAIEIEHEGLKRRYTDAHTPPGFAFVGVNAYGDHRRVHYFPGATVQGST